VTPHELDLAAALGRCAGWTGARFTNDMAALVHTSPDRDLTDRQRYYMEILAWRYRRQLPAHLVPDTKPPPLPPVRKEPKPKKQKKPAAAEPTTGDLFDRIAGA
jgi:hypothetical protein